MTGAMPAAALTVAALRAFLTAHPGLPDDLPIIIGGPDFDDPTTTWTGRADHVWIDDPEGPDARLCLAALGIGMVNTPDGL